MRKLIFIVVAGIVALVTSCSFHHTCPTYIGAVSPHSSHIQHHPHH